MPWIGCWKRLSEEIKVRSSPSSVWRINALFFRPLTSGASWSSCSSLWCRWGSLDDGEPPKGCLLILLILLFSTEGYTASVIQRCHSPARDHGHQQTPAALQALSPSALVQPTLHCSPLNRSLPHPRSALIHLIPRLQLMLRTEITKKVTISLFFKNILKKKLLFKDPMPQIDGAS